MSTASDSTATGVNLPFSTDSESKGPLPLFLFPPFSCLQGKCLPACELLLFAYFPNEGLSYREGGEDAVQDSRDAALVHNPASEVRAVRLFLLFFKFLPLLLGSYSLLCSALFSQAMTPFTHLC